MVRRQDFGFLHLPLSEDPQVLWHLKEGYTRGDWDMRSSLLKNGKKAMMEIGMSEDAAEQLVELSQAISEGVLAVNQPRTTENTTQTSIEEFADVFAGACESA